MTDREVLLIAYGAIKALCAENDNLQEIESLISAHLDKKPISEEKTVIPEVKEEVKK